MRPTRLAAAYQLAQPASGLLLDEHGDVLGDTRTYQRIVGLAHVLRDQRSRHVVSEIRCEPLLDEADLHRDLFRGDPDPAVTSYRHAARVVGHKIKRQPVHRTFIYLSSSRFR